MKILNNKGPKIDSIIGSYSCCHSLLFVVVLCHTFSLFATRCTTSCQSLSLIVTRCTTRCHSLSLIEPLVVTRCHSLSLVVPLIVTRCHSLSLFVTRCTTRLSFYKRSLGNYFLISAAFDSLQYNELNLLLQLTDF